ncbi:hypothetical protein BCR34DRAFT_600823 [Clohesyomyces aquaticus]|uniref:Only prolin and serin are matching in the corresponding protein n=1 Tax=Clohesyomyces aquaticus TaxID=1231657 RepID=A0A1Y1ZPT7_9PLEO|nr:hypothetical protein BCR34DRAFT_600823 [Clohesyomyces aquaticus]
MREMKPLILPQLVAARKSSKSSFDMSTYDPAASVYSYADSGFYSVSSECSTPPTPSFSARGHFRNPSSTSSLSSSPPNYDPIDLPNGSGKLPKLTEEPMREEDFVDVEYYRCSCDSDDCMHARPSTRRSGFGQTYEDYFGNDSESPFAKRRRSVESSANSITSRIGSRFPSLRKNLRDRKRTSTLGRSTRSATPSRVSSTRTSSMTSSIHPGFDLSEKRPSTSARTSNERLHESFTSAPIDIAKANALDVDADQAEESERFATTPLLPPLLVKSRLNDVPTQSPLQSPTVADSNVATPFGTPPVRAYPTPPLSSKPSVSSFKASRPGYLVPSSEIPPLMIGDKDDEWATKLGHANFTIQPEPYVPDVCDATALRQLFADWEQARCNYTKHQVRTGEHFGVTSKTYLLTEQKWAQIDKLWKQNNDLALSRAAARGEELEPSSPLEPAPLSKMPTLNDPRSEGKFPKLGDEDIVGPMVQIAAQIQMQPTRKRAFFKFFSDMKFPGSLFGRSSAGYRTTR